MFEYIFYSGIVRTSMWEKWFLSSSFFNSSSRLFVTNQFFC